MPSLIACARIAEDVYHDRPTAISVYRPIAVPDQQSHGAGGEFSAGAYAGSDGVGFIAFRGTRQIDDWKGANLEILRRQLPAQRFGSALAYFAAAHRALNRLGCARYLVVGHSLGGGIAALVAGEVTWVPVRGVTFNAPGLAQFASQEDGTVLDLAHRNAANVFNFRSEVDVVSRWGSHIGAVYEVPGAGRHGIDAFIGCLDACPMGGWKM
jgi:pimeloyl-ACP methyl ester carboxylesterase